MAANDKCTCDERRNSIAKHDVMRLTMMNNKVNKKFKDLDPFQFAVVNCEKQVLNQIKLKIY